MSLYTVTAGHSDTQPGNTWNGHREADLMLRLRHIVAAKLRADGHMVREDGRRGENLPLVSAQRLIDGSRLALELHTNGSTNPRAEGVEVVARPELKREAQAIAHAIGGVLQIPTRRVGGWWPMDELVRERGFTPGFANRGGLIVEVFFQSNPRELAKYLERHWLVAGAIARAVQEVAP